MIGKLVYMWLNFIYFVFHHHILFILCNLINLFHSIYLSIPLFTLYICIYLYFILVNNSLFYLILVTFFVRYTLWSPLWTIPYLHYTTDRDFFKLMLLLGLSVCHLSKASSPSWWNDWVTGWSVNPHHAHVALGMSLKRCQPTLRSICKTWFNKRFK